MEKIIKLIQVFIFLVITTAFEDQPKDVKKIISFLNNLETLSSNFIQIDSRGEIFKGKISLQKPSRFRIEYDEPNNQLIICDGFKIALINKKLKNFTTYSMKDTPLNFFLINKITSENFKIVKFKKKDNTLIIQIINNLAKDIGRVKLVFEEKPFQLKKWVLYNKNGGATSTTLNDLYINEQIDKREFEIIDPQDKIFIEKF